MRLLFALLILVATPVWGQTNLQSFWYTFDGQWMPDVDSSLIGPKNYQTLKNMRYSDGGLEGIQGYDILNSTAPETEHYRPRSGFHYKKDYPQESHVIVQFFDSLLSKSVLYDNETPVPYEGDFNPSVLHTDEAYTENIVSSAGHKLMFANTSDTVFADTSVTVWQDINTEQILSYETFHAFFSNAPNQALAYSNGVNNYIWLGNEANVAAFLSCTSEVTKYLVNAVDYTIELSNSINNSDNTATLTASGTSSYFVVLTPLPISGITPYISSANATSGKVQGSTWSGTTWTVLGNITDGTSNMQQSGFVGFDSTVDTSVPWYFDGRLFYAYQFQFAGSAGLYQVTAKYPWQKIKDIWDGNPRTCVGFHVFDKEKGTYKDYTLEVAEGSSGLYPIGAEIGGLTADEHVIVLFEDKTQAIDLGVLSGNTNPITSGATIHYYSGTTWVPVGQMYDSTFFSGVTPLNQSGYKTWNPPDKESPFTEFGKYAYGYKISWPGTLGGTNAAEAAVIIDTVHGVPAPLDVPPFRVPLLYRNRLLLCNYAKGNQPNRCDVCIPNSPFSWNGIESSDDGRNSLYFGSGGEILAGAQLYNRYGSNVFTSLIVFESNKTHLLLGSTFDETSSDRFQIHTIAENVGCPAPHTVTVLEVGYEMVSEELLRNVVVWLSATGPMSFDGSVMQPIKGIDNYFDQSDDDYIGSDAFETAFAWYDSVHREWNLRVSDYWFVYDFLRRKWYQKDTGSASMPGIAFQTTDTKGNRYIYGGIDGGWLARMEYGNSWDGTAIKYEIETGDFYPTGNAWDQTLMRRVKVAHKVIDESATLSLVYYSDVESGNTIASIDLSDGTSGKVTRKTYGISAIPAWIHRFKFMAETSGTTRGYQPMGWGFQTRPEREDLN